MADEEPTIGGFDARIQVQISQGIVYLRQEAEHLFMESHMSPENARRLSKALFEAADAAERVAQGSETIS